jgi:hypothetical protein
MTGMLIAGSAEPDRGDWFEHPDMIDEIDWDGWLLEANQARP